MDRHDRKHERKPFSQPGWIDRGRGLDLIPCQIQDVSESGAKLAVENVSAVPEQFQLLFSQTFRKGRLCVVRQRFADAVGVQFLKP